MLVPTHNLPQTAPDTIADYRASEPTRGNEADATQAGILDCNRAERKQFAAPHHALSFYALVFGRARQAASF
jgi:hypothetical protein